MSTIIFVNLFINHVFKTVGQISLININFAGSCQLYLCLFIVFNPKPILRACTACVLYQFVIYDIHHFRACTACCWHMIANSKVYLPIVKWSNFPLP